jgi:hypothetical protein
MPTQFGQKPTSERIFVRVQHIAGNGKILKTESMNVWQETFENVLYAVTQALNVRFGGRSEDGVEEAPVPIKGRVRRGRKA